MVLFLFAPFLWNSASNFLLPSMTATANRFHAPWELKDGPTSPLPREIELDKLREIVPLALAPEPEHSPAPAASQNGHHREPVNYDIRRMVQAASLPVTEPVADAEGASDKEAYMAGVLAKFRMHLEERTRHHLGKLGKWLLTIR